MNWMETLQSSRDITGNEFCNVTVLSLKVSVMSIGFSYMYPVII
jgi:hypothetical protein